MKNDDEKTCLFKHTETHGGLSWVTVNEIKEQMKHLGYKVEKIKDSY